MCCQKYAKYAIKYAEYAKYVILEKIFRIYLQVADGPARPGAAPRRSRFNLPENPHLMRHCRARRCRGGGGSHDEGRAGPAGSRAAPGAPRRRRRPRQRPGRPVRVFLLLTRALPGPRASCPRKPGSAAQSQKLRKH